MGQDIYSFEKHIWKQNCWKLGPIYKSDSNWWFSKFLLLYLLLKDITVMVTGGGC